MPISLNYLDLHPPSRSFLATSKITPTKNHPLQKSKLGNADFRLQNVVSAVEKETSKESARNHRKLSICKCMLIIRMSSIFISTVTAHVRATALTHCSSSDSTQLAYPGRYKWDRPKRTPCFFLLIPSSRRES